ncbi:MAG: dihydrofolate reductase family protein [Anaerolineae bacterium]|nr:dihydrofolate reductase family protein [Anaerolineae bacterium]
MRKVIVSVETTLNGVMSVADWSFPHSQERMDYSRELLFSSDAILMGRETYDVFSTYWPEKEKSGDGTTGEEGFAERINSIAKYVASTTLKEVKWNNSHLIKGDVAQEVSRLKQQPGMNIVMYGAGPVAHTLVQHGLVDELHVQLFPVIAAINENSTRLFNDAGDIPALKLMETKPLASGIVIHQYRFGTNA